MKRILFSSVAVVALLTATQVSQAAVTTFFVDTFTSGSTLNGTSFPGGTAPNSFTSYDIASTKNTTNSGMSNGWINCKLNATTSSAWWEAQALFTASTNPVALSQVGDFISMAIVFTNVGGSLLGSGTASAIYTGLFNSGKVAPLPGTLNNAGLGSSVTFASGGVQNWQGYVGQVTSNGNSRLYIRPAQNSGTSANQDLVAIGAGTGAAGGTVLSTLTATPVALVPDGQYTSLFTISLVSDGILSISNAIFSGSGTGGTLVFSQMVLTNNAVTSFDGLGFGAFHKNAPNGNPNLAITSISISGQTTTVTNPPSIDSQPVSVAAAVGSLAALQVSASGFGMTYQWHRNGTNLIDSATISGSTTPTLIIAPISASDFSSSYYVTVTGTGNYTTNSATCSITMRSSANLTWVGNSAVWDLATTPNWNDGSVRFYEGDAVTFDDSGTLQTVTVTGSYVSPSKVTVNSSLLYTFSGTGNIAGPAKVNYIGSGRLVINNANTYTGGTLVSNTSVLILGNQNALGTGPVTLAQAGGELRLYATGGSAAGLGGLVVADDFTLTACSNTYGAVVLGDIAGTTGKTLTINTPLELAAVGLDLPATNCRIRLYGTNTVCNANLVLNDPVLQMALYGGSGSQTYNGVISGPGMMIARGNGTTILNNQNTFSGGITPTSGTIGFGCDSTPTSGSVTSGPIGNGPIMMGNEAGSSSANGMFAAWGGARTIANQIVYSNTTGSVIFNVGGTNPLTFTGSCNLQGLDGTGNTNRTFQVTNTALTIMSGQIGDGGLACGLTKTGTGVLALNNNETYTGTTTVSAGTLQVNGQLGAGAVTVATNGALTGTGTIGGPVTVALGGSIGAGAAGTGTLTINNSLSLVGNLQIKVNKSSTPRADNLVVSGTLANTGTGTLTVTNLGSALAPGDSFTVFNKAVTGVGAMNVTGAGAVWTNKLAIDGTIGVLYVVATTGGPLSNSVSGSTLTLSWPANYLTWKLQSNAVSLVSTNWYEVPGSSNVLQMQFPINTSKTNVFYRLFRTLP